MSVNKHIILGTLGKDPELRSTASGKSVCSFSVATNRIVNKEKVTDWHNIIVWEKAAEACAKYLSKGKQVYVEGTSATRSYEGRDGAIRYITEVIANSVNFIDQNKKKENMVENDNTGFDIDEEVPF